MLPAGSQNKKKEGDQDMEGQSAKFDWSAWKWTDEYRCEYRYRQSQHGVLEYQYRKSILQAPSPGREILELENRLQHTSIAPQSGQQPIESGNTPIVHQSGPPIPNQYISRGEYGEYSNEVDNAEGGALDNTADNKVDGQEEKKEYSTPDTQYPSNQMDSPVQSKDILTGRKQDSTLDAKHASKTERRGTDSRKTSSKHKSTSSRSKTSTKNKEKQPPKPHSSKQSTSSRIRETPQQERYIDDPLPTSSTSDAVTRTQTQAYREYPAAGSSRQPYCATEKPLRAPVQSWAQNQASQTPQFSDPNPSEQISSTTEQSTQYQISQAPRFSDQNPSQQAYYTTGQPLRSPFQPWTQYPGLQHHDDPWGNQETDDNENRLRFIADDTGS